MQTRMTLQDGTVYERTAQTTRNWKSRLMDLVPYGTSVLGARFEIVKEETR